MIAKSSVKHLDKEAVRIARENYKIKRNREHVSAEVDAMSEEAFLTKLKLVVDGKLNVILAKRALTGNLPPMMREIN